MLRPESKVPAVPPSPRQLRKPTTWDRSSLLQHSPQEPARARVATWEMPISTVATKLACRRGERGARGHRNIGKTVAQFAADPKRELFETLGKKLKLASFGTEACLPMNGGSMYSSARTHPGGALASAASRIIRKFLMFSRKTWRSSCRRAMASGSFMVPPPPALRCRPVWCQLVVGRPDAAQTWLFADDRPQRIAGDLCRALALDPARRQQANDDVRLLPVLTQ